jgi:hypothetical protein
MFKPVEGGSVYEVPDNAFGFIFKCNVPPLGYGVDSMTGNLEPVDILKRSDIETEMKWERPELPKNYKELRKIEQGKREFDKKYSDPYLKTIRKREWHRRRCGVWFWNYNPKKGKAEPIYITGIHYFYLTYWKFQGKWLDFRINDLECWYIIRYCETDPDCLGLNEITKRKLGKTARLGCWLYERTSRIKNSHGALQSKSDDDAAEVMKKAIVHPWQKLPDFFRPIYDTMKGDEPDDLRFFHTARRGASANEDKEEEALESWIDYWAASDGALDGPELDTYGADEAGKLKRPNSIKERQNTVRYCSEIDGEFLWRKQWYTTTVEVDEKEGEEENIEFQDLTTDSNALERNDNNRTMSGLYTYFLPAQKGMFFDEYGYPDEERALTFINNTINGYLRKGDTRGLASFKRKNPRTLKEAFSADGARALYDPELLNRQWDAVGWTNKLTEYGDLIWKDGFEFKRPVANAKGEIDWVPNQLLWVPNIEGKYEKLKGWEPRDANKVIWNGTSFVPNNDAYMALGCDPFKYDKTKDKRRSNCAAFAYQMPDTTLPDPFDDYFTLRYARREAGTRLANMDVLKMAWWCGSTVLFERNVNHWKDHFREWECSEFLDWMPGEVEPGVAASSTELQTLCNYTEAYINEHIGKMYFKNLIRKETGWLGFKVEDTEKYDEPMGAGVTLIQKNKKLYKSKARTGYGLQDFFPKRKTA